MFLAWCSGFVPTRFAHLCSRMLTHQWPKISSDFICVYEKNRWRRGSAPDLAEEAHDAPPVRSRPPTARACGARTLRFAPSTLVADCGAQIMVTLAYAGRANEL